MSWSPRAATQARRTYLFVVCFLFVVVNGDPGCTNILYFKQRFSHFNIGLLEAHTRAGGTSDNHY